MSSPADGGAAPAVSSPISPASTSMSVLLAAKKLKLEALKAQRIRRQSLAADQAARTAASKQQGIALIATTDAPDDDDDDDDEAAAQQEADDGSENEARAMGITETLHAAPSTTLNDSTVSASLDDSTASVAPSGLSSPAMLSPPSFTRSKSRQSDASLLSIKHSLDELATHGAQQPAVPEAVVVKACAAFRRMSLIGHKTLPMPTRSISRGKSGQFSPTELATPKSPVSRTHSSSNAVAAASGFEASSPSANGHAAAVSTPDNLSAASRQSTAPLPELLLGDDNAEPAATDIEAKAGTAAAATGSSESQAPASPSSSAAGPTSHAAQIDELLSQIGELSEAVRSKNEDLAMAGDLGSVLLQHNEDAQRKIDELTSLLDSSAQRIAALENEVRHGDRSMRKLMTKHQSEIRWMEQENQGESEILRMEFEIERQNWRHAEEHWKARAKESAAREEADAERGTELDAMRTHMHKLESQVADMKRHNFELDEALSSLREERGELSAEIDRLSRIEAKYTELQGELAVLKKQDTINVLAELQWENQRMVSAMQELNAEYEAVLDAQAHDATLLETLQRRNEQLEREAHAARVGNQTLRTPAQQQRAFESLADDEVIEELPTPTNAALELQRNASSPQQPSSPIAAPVAIPTAIVASTPAPVDDSAVSVVVTPVPAPASALPPPHPVSSAAAPAPSSSTIPPPIFPPSKSSSVDSAPSSPASPPSPTAGADSSVLPPIASAPNANVTVRKSSSKAKPSAADEAFAAEQEILSVARLAAECAQKGPHSSLASGSASLAYSSAAAFSPAKRHSMFHVSSANSPSLLGAQSSASSSSLGSGISGMGSGGSHHVRTKTPQRGGFSGFLSSLLPGSTGAAAATTASPRQTSGGAATAAAMAMSGVSGNSAHKLSFTPTSSHPLSPGAVDVSETAAPTPERNSSHRSTPLKASASSRLPSEGRDADFEFFALTLLCVKINGARRMESLYTISTQDLWNKAKAEDIQFHQYTSWLEKEIAQAYVSKLSTAAKDGSDGEPILESFLPSNSSVSSSSGAAGGRSRATSNSVANAAVIAATAAAVGNANVPPSVPVTTGSQAPPHLQLHSVARSPTPI